MSVSAVVLTKNEEKNIEACLASLQWCYEIIVIDDNSVDNTMAIANKLGAKVFNHSLDYNFAKQRNFGLEKAKGEWVLFVDADERVPTSLCDEIIQYANNPINKCNGYYIKRVDTMWKKVLKHGETGNIRLLRLAKKEAGKWHGNVHEVWEVKGETTVLQNPILHYPHQTLTEFLQEINFYTTLRAEDLFKRKVKVAWWHIIAYPKAKFVQNYIFRLGILDGNAGIVFALCMCFHSFLVRGKLWQLWQKK